MMNADDYSIALIPDLIDRVYVAGHSIAAARDVDAMLRAFLDAISNPNSPHDPVATIDRVSISTVDNDSSLVIAAAWDSQSERTPIPGSPYGLLSGAALGLVAQGETLFIDDLFGDPRLDQGERSSLSRSGLSAFIFVPLLIESRWLGLLTIASRRIMGFSPDVVRMSQIIADQMALSMARHIALAETEPFTVTSHEQPEGDSLHDFIGRAGDSIITIDVKREILSFNPAAEDLFGYAAPDVIGFPVALLLPPQRRQEYEAWTRRVFDEGRPAKGDSERVTKDGRVLQVYTTMWPIKGADGSVNALAELTVDTTAQIAVQNALHEERDLIEAILEATNDAIIMIDAQRKIVTTNLQFEKFFQIPRHYLAQRTVDQLMEHIHTRQDLPDDLAILLLTFTGDEYQSAAGDFDITVEEHRVLVWYSTPVHAPDGLRLGRLFVFRDATHEREVDRMKTEFVSLVSHELRTPLTSIKGFTDFILDGDAGEIGPEVREYLDIVKFNADRLISLINDILDITRIEAGRIELKRSLHPIDAIIGSSSRMMQPIIEQHGQRYTASIAPDLPQVWIDRERMTQVLTNLVSNASKYTPDGGSLTVSARLLEILESADEPVVPSNAAVPAVLVSVSDTGMGISEKDQVNLFTRFYRTKEATEKQIAGTGLGLTIVKSFVELHGGQIWVKSEVGHGSTFYFTIPLVEG